MTMQSHRLAQQSLSSEKADSFGAALKEGMSGIWNGVGGPNITHKLRRTMFGSSDKLGGEPLPGSMTYTHGAPPPGLIPGVAPTSSIY